MSENVQKEDKVEGLEQEIANLRNQLEKEKKDHEELRNKFLYLSADFDNFIKRVEKERQSLLLNERERILTKVLPLVDELEMVLNLTKDKDSSLYEGIKMIRDKFFNLLKEEGFEAIEALGKPFNPKYHEVLEGDKGEKVVEEFRKGFIFMGKVIRPSVVKLEKVKGDKHE
ncbi:MAG: nucleotide exchange factor GrpE [Nitrososphaerales archaeon]